MNEEHNNNQNDNLSMPFYTAPVASDGSTTEVNYNPPVATPPPVQPAPQPVQQPVQQAVQTTEQSIIPEKYKQQPVTPQGFTPGTVSEYAKDESLVVDDSDRLVKAFIGKNYDKFLTKSFSWPYFFFGMNYLLYRKMYAKAIILSTVSVALGLILQLIFPLLIGICAVPPVIIMFLYTFKVNSSYYYFANKKVKKIEYAHPELDKDQLEKLCASKGGGSILNYLLGSIIYSFAMSIVGGIVTFIVVMVLMANGPTYKGEDFAKENFDIDAFTYTLPESYEKDETNEIEHVYNYLEKKKTVCHFSMDKLADYKSAEKLSEEFLKYGNENLMDKNEDKYKQRDNFKGTGNEWYVIEKGDNLRYYFGEINEEEVYLITLTSDTNDYSVTSKCFIDAETFIGSLKTR